MALITVTKVRSMKLDLYQIDAFARGIFEGNPAAVCPLAEWIPDGLMQQIAMENNLSETAFFVEVDGRFDLRWFTPEAEVDLCGHATLASAHLLFHHLGYGSDTIFFDTRSGELTVSREGDLLLMNFPAARPEETELPAGMEQALGVTPGKCYRATDYLLILDREQAVRDLEPDFTAMKKIDTRGVIVTAPGEEVDFVSRFFAPAVGINEDPVTGSAHTLLTPYWSGRLGKRDLRARQISKRGGELRCRLLGDRVEIGGYAKTYMTGIITIPD